MKRRTIRRAVLASLFLLAGAIMSIAVSWGIVIWHELWRGEARRELDFAIPLRGGEGELVLMGGIDSYYGMEVCTGLVMVSRKLPERFVTSDADLPQWFVVPPAGFGESRTVLAAGFPLLCMTLEMDDGSSRMPRYRGVLRLPMIRETPVVMVPLRPMYVRLLVNSLFYATALHFVLCGIRALRRQRRIRRGNCPFCNYDMRAIGSSPCPECGRATPHRLGSAP